MYSDFIFYLLKNNFRISKVFSQPGIAELIKNAESGLERTNKSQMMPSLLDGDSLSLDYDRELVLSAAKQCQAGPIFFPKLYTLPIRLEKGF